MIQKKSQEDIFAQFETINNNLEETITRYKVFTENQEDEEKIKESAIKIIGRISVLALVPFEHALVGTCALLQAGSYLRNVSNRKIRILQTDFTKKELIFASEQIGNTYTLRAIARSIKDTIVKISIIHKIPGHLYAQFKIEHPEHIPNFNDPEKMKIAAYCTDFQLENPETPQIVKEFLSNRLKNRNITNRK